MTITTDDVRRLLAAGPDAQLVVRAGHAHVLPKSEVNAAELVVLSHAELEKQLGGHHPSDEFVDQLALRLDAAVSMMGG